MKKFLFFCLFFFAGISIKAQMIDSMLKIYSAQVPDQKIYVHFDKDLYRAGETIWFKAYLFSGFGLSVNSKNFYAELIDGKGNIVQRKVYPITESSSAGNFDLADSLLAGNFIFRGYTTWMLNFDTSFIFQKNIAVTNNAGLAEKKNTNELKSYSLQFFPEGGNLVSRLQSVVGFKANDETGKPVFAKGNIVNSKGTVVTTFSSVHDGMGTFNLSPEANEKYQAQWIDPAGKQQTFALPQAKAEGLVLTLTAFAHKKILFKLSWSNDVPESWEKVNIVALLGQEKVYEAKANITDVKINSGSIPVENLPSGILQVTVFSETWEPIAERIIMINNENYLFKAEVNTSELTTNFRAKNTIEIKVDDTLLSNLSLAITDADFGLQISADNIISRMLLTGDIKGEVYNPTYYFANNADSTVKNLDLVMLTHGWRKYNWTDLARGRKPTLKYPFDNYLSLDARVSGVTSVSPLRNDEELLIFLKGKDSSSTFLQMPKTSGDKFTLPDIIFYDTAIVYYGFLKDKKAEKKKSVVFHTNFYEGVKKIDLLNHPFNLEIDAAAIARTKLVAEKLFQIPAKFDRKIKMLKEVRVKTYIKTPMEQLDEKYTSGSFKGAEGFSFDFTSKETHFLDVFYYLQGKVPNLYIANLGSRKPVVLYRGSATALFLNEISTDAEELATVQANNIAYIKVIRPPFMGAAMGGAGGAIAVYTKKGGDEKPEPRKGLNKSVVTGYSAAKEFYSPNYKDLSGSSAVEADYRTTLYWNPVILTDASMKKVRFEFYNNNITKAFRVILEGVNEIGKLVRIEKVIH